LKTIKVSPGQGFKLPFLGKDAFKLLSQSGLYYNRKKRLFYVREGADLGAVNALLATRGIRISLLKRCSICGRGLDCDECEFSDSCERKQDYCVCDKCLAKPEVFDLYSEAQREYLNIRH